MAGHRGRESKPGSPKCEVGVLSTRTQRSVGFEGVQIKLTFKSSLRFLSNIYQEKF